MSTRPQVRILSHRSVRDCFLKRSFFNGKFSLPQKLDGISVIAIAAGLIASVFDEAIAQSKKSSVFLTSEVVNELWLASILLV